MIFGGVGFAYALPPFSPIFHIFILTPTVSKYFAVKVFGIKDSDSVEIFQIRTPLSPFSHTHPPSYFPEFFTFLF